MGLCTKLCDQKWLSSEEKVYICLNYSNGPVAEKRDFLEKLKGAVSRVSSFYATFKKNDFLFQIHL